MIRDSRVEGTTHDRHGDRRRSSIRPACWSPPRRSGSTGTPATATVDESDPPGPASLADVVVEWEAAADPARDAGIRVVHPRTGLVVVRPGRGLGPAVADRQGGRRRQAGQRTAVVVLHLTARRGRRPDAPAGPTWTGPVNLTAPNPVTNAEMTRAMGELLQPADRPAGPRQGPAAGRSASSPQRCSGACGCGRHACSRRASSSRTRPSTRPWPGLGHALTITARLARLVTRPVGSLHAVTSTTRHPSGSVGSSANVTDHRVRPASGTL